MPRLIIVALFLLIGLVVYVQAENPPADIDRAWYDQRYSFMSYDDTFYTFESRFDFPEGFHRPDSSAMTDFQYWVSHMPLWPEGRWVVRFGGRRIIRWDSVSAVVNLPWVHYVANEYGMALKMWAEYLRYKHNDFDLRWMPLKGDEITYEKFLKGSPARNNRGEFFFQEGEPRDTAYIEYFNCLTQIALNTNFKGMAQNMTPVDESELAPGDIYLGYTGRGKKGFTYIILNMIQNDSGDKLYAIATGATPSCELYIPIFNDDRKNPWITTEQIKEFAPQADSTGFYRFKF